jgi:1-acyl-sn-glycerol-3-phosphate acyltransferase
MSSSCACATLRANVRTLKLCGVVAVVAAGFAAAVFFPAFPETFKSTITRLWARSLLAVLGVELEVEGELRDGPALIVANHVSWLDILAITALRPSMFVCKAEIAAWPALGWLLARAGTIFLRRGSAVAASEAARVAARRLRAGISVAAFPEGTSTDGRTVLPFHAALFQAAVDAGCAVQPLALRYSNEAAVYAGDTDFGDSLAAVAGAGGLTVGLAVLPAFAGIDRREAAKRAHALVGASLAAAPAPGMFPAAPGHALAVEAGLATAQGGRQGLV